MRTRTEVVVAVCLVFLFGYLMPTLWFLRAHIKNPALRLALAILLAIPVLNIPVYFAFRLLCRPTPMELVSH
jgi:hypothetical protein